MITEGFVPPPYPYDRLNRLVPVAERHPGGVVDLSIGTPIDAPPAAVVAALSTSGSERGYPPSIGTIALREAAARWIARRFGADVGADAIGACVGTKEFVGTLPQWLRLRSPDRDTVLYPSVSYPTYAMGAQLAGCRAVGVPLSAEGRLRLETIDPDDAGRALALWVNSPGNPTGGVDDLGEVARWGRDTGCRSSPTSATSNSPGPGPVTASSSTARPAWSPFTRCRSGRTWPVSGSGSTPATRSWCSTCRRCASTSACSCRTGQAAGVVALDDDEHVEGQRRRYRHRLERMAEILGAWTGRPVALPAGGFYLWVDVADDWDFTERLAAEGGALVSPGDFYGSTDHVRVAVVQPDDRIELVAERLGV